MEKYLCEDLEDKDKDVGVNDEEKNEGALRISTFPVPYTFPYPPLAVNLDDAGNDTAASAYRLQTSGIADGEWHNLTCVFDKDVGLTFYKDGVSLGSKAATHITGTVTSPSVDLRLGYYNEAGTADFFDGSISQVKLHNRVLSAHEVKEAYNGQRVPYQYVGANQTELVQYGTAESFSGTGVATGWTYGGGTFAEENTIIHDYRTNKSKV